MKAKSICTLLLSLGLSACATAPTGSTIVNNSADVPTIQQAYSRQLSQIYTGMSISKFKAIIPQAYIAGENESVTAYELDYDISYVTKQQLAEQNFWIGFGSPPANAEKQILWFYFYKDNLIKWGRPQDWPEFPTTAANQTS
jgi:hypothetical protein